MNSTDLIATIKASLLQELRRKRRWQTYVVAFGITLCFFLVVGNVLGESKAEPKPEPIASEPVKPKQKVEGFQLVDNRKEARSTWEVSTELEQSPLSGQTDQPRETEATTSITKAARLAASKAEPQTTRSPEDDKQLAGQVTTEFYAALNEGHVGEAYDKLSPEFQADLPFEHFQYGYQGVESISCEVKHSEQLTSNQIRLDVQINAYEGGSDNTYYATCILSRCQDTWAIAGVAQLEAF